MALKSFLNALIFKTIGTTNFVRRIEWRTIFDWVNLQGNEKILDVACGTGDLTLKIAEKGCEVDGIDIAADEVAAAKRCAPCLIGLQLIKSNQLKVENE